MYTLVSASVLALDLVRHPSGAAVADALDTALVLDGAALQPPARPGEVDLERPATRVRLRAVAARAPRLDEALRAVSRSLGTPEAPAAASVLHAALVGRLDDLVALLEDELGRGRALPPHVVDVVVDRVVAAWVQADPAVAARDLVRLRAPWTALVGELPAPPPTQGAVPELLLLLEAVARADAGRWAALEAAHTAHHTALAWSGLVHAASRAAVEADRTVPVARWQLSAVRAAHAGAAGLPGPCPAGAAMSVVGAVQALAVADALPHAVVDPLLEPCRAALDLPL